MNIEYHEHQNVSIISILEEDKLFGLSKKILNEYTNYLLFVCVIIDGNELNIINLSFNLYIIIIIIKYDISALLLFILSILFLIYNFQLQY